MSYLTCPAECHVPQVPPQSGFCWGLSRLGLREDRDVLIS